MTTFEQKIKSYISSHKLLHHEGFYLVALSGGADSVALLCALKSLGYSVSAVHCNFRLRGEESFRDEMFCVSLCEALQVTLHRIHFDTQAYARLHKVSIEMAARELRYRYFEQLRRDVGADGICVAHHQDDQVETVLLNLVRGTGLDGLLGMKPQNGNILRPMLGVTRAETEQYLSACGRSFVTDSTNLEDEVLRNKLRLNIIPQLEQLNAAVKENVVRMTENLGEAAKVVEEALAKDAQAARTADGGIDLEVVAGCPSPSYLLWSMLKEFGFRRSQVLEMLDRQRSGAQWEAAAHVALRDRRHLYIVSRKVWEHELPTLKVPETGVYRYPMMAADGGENDGAACAVRFGISALWAEGDFVISKAPDVVDMDADKVAFPLVIRPVQEGDRFVPFGMTGSKLVSDFLTDRKVSPVARRRQLVVCDAGGAIVWLVSLRLDGRVAVDGGTQRVLRLSAERIVT